MVFDYFVCTKETKLIMLILKKSLLGGVKLYTEQGIAILLHLLQQLSLLQGTQIKYLYISLFVCVSYTFSCIVKSAYLWNGWIDYYFFLFPPLFVVA